MEVSGIMENFSAGITATSIRQCTEDIIDAVHGNRLTLDMQIRAYDLLDAVLASDSSGLPEEASGAAADFCRQYGQSCEALEKMYDEEALRNEAARMLEPLKQKMNDARFAAASAASLHEFAKEVFGIWQTSGIFARRRALKELRERAGFRLESHRIGNYVAKTFDLMNEAQARFAQAQQTMFSSDVSYKIRPGVHKDIANVFHSFI